MVTGFKRGIPEFEDESGNRYGMLCETKEDCITDEEGINLTNKLKKVQEAIDSVTTEINDTINDEIDKKVGELNDLSTDDKNTLVSAINEVFGDLSAFQDNVSNELQTINSDVDDLQVDSNNMKTKLERIEITKFLGQNYTMTSSDFNKVGFYLIGSLVDTVTEEGFENAPDNNPGDYKVLALNSDKTYQVLLLTSPRYSEDTLYVGKFWNNNWKGWHQIALVENISNPSILINGDFKTNQRGKSEYVNTTTANNQYTVDRWRIHNSSTVLTVHDGYITMSNSVEDGQNHYISQYFENPIPNGTTLTLSFKYRNATGEIYSGDNGSGTIIKLEHSAEWKVFSVTWKTNKKIERVLIAQTFSNNPSNIGSVDIAWAKLELGSVATQFVPPNPTEELMKCQQYYREIIGEWRAAYYSPANKRLVFGLGNLRMRTNPTCKFKSSLFNTSEGVWVSSSANAGLFTGLTFFTGHGSRGLVVEVSDAHETDGVLIIVEGNPIIADAEIY